MLDNIGGTIIPLSLQQIPLTDKVFITLRQYIIACYDSIGKKGR